MELIAAILTLLIVGMMMLVVSAWARFNAFSKRLEMDPIRSKLHRQNGTFKSYLDERYQYAISLVSWELKRELAAALQDQKYEPAQVEFMTDAAVDMFINGAVLELYLTKTATTNQVVYGFNLITPERRLYCLKAEPWAFAKNTATVQHAYAALSKFAAKHSTKPVNR